MAPTATVRKRWAVDRQQFLILLIASVMIGSFVLLVLWPKQKELADLGSVVTRQRDLVTEKVRTSQEGIYVSARIPALRRLQERLDRRLPPEPRLAEFLQAVAERVEAEPGVSHEIQRTEASASGPAPAVSLRLRLTGPYEGVHRCLAQIEELERLNRFRRVHFKRVGDGKVVADAEVFIYYLSPGKSATAEAARQGSGTRLQGTSG